MSRPLDGAAGAVVSAASATPSFVAVPPAARQFWVHASAAAFITARNVNTDTTNLTVANAQPLAAAMLYGPFDIMRSYDKFIAVAGNGGASTVTITFGV
jgi:hypothetical protein